MQVKELDHVQYMEKGDPRGHCNCSLVPIAVGHRYRTEINASWNAWLSGLLVAGLAVSALAVYAEWRRG